jgi:hypothetical protein
MRQVKDEGSGTFHQRFTPIEDQALILLVTRHGAHHWKKIAKSMPGRNARQCRDRFKNYLNPNQISESWSREEDRILIERVAEIGPHWFRMTPFLPGRSNHAIKNRWYTHLRPKDSLGTEQSPQTENLPKCPIIIRIEGDRPVAPKTPRSPALAMLLNP